MGRSGVNIYDIAQRAGVSIATVSRVLAGGANVSEKTRRRVAEVIDALDYTPNAFARGLGLGSMRMVGLLCTDVSDIYYAKAVSILERLLRQNGLDALLCCTGNSLPDKKKAFGLLLAKGVDAVILIGSAFKEQNDNSHIEQAAARVPVIVINGLIECENTYCVLCDEETAVCEAAGALCDQCGTDVLYLYDSQTYSGAQKLAGFRRALAQRGAASGAARALRVDKSLEAAEEAVRSALAQERPVRGVMASEDLLAVGALRALRAAGSSAPVIGFNNSVLARCATPPLTSVDNMVETLCTTACGILTDVLEGRGAAARVVLTARLVERETFQSCAPCADLNGASK